MRHLMVAALVACALASLPASAQDTGETVGTVQASIGTNTGDWTRTDGSLTNPDLTAGGCIRYDWTSTTASKLLYVAGVTLSLDRAGSQTGNATIYTCSSIDSDQDGTEDTSDCRAAQWDPDGDGAFEDMQLQDATGKRGVAGVQLSEYLYVSPDTANGGVTVCAEAK